MASTKSSISKIERFSGNRAEFVIWKDKLLTFVRAVDEEYQRGLLEKSKPDADVLMRDFLETSPPCPPEDDKSDEGRWKVAHWRRARMDIQQLLNQVLPNQFVSTLPNTVSQMEPCEVWRMTERAYGDSDASTLIALSQQWQKALTSNWKDIRSLFAQLKKIRNEANRKCAAVQLTGEMFSEILLCTEVLNQLPTEVWASSIKPSGESYTIELVETALVTLFGDKSRQEIAGRQRSGAAGAAQPQPKVVNVAKPLQKKRKGPDTEEGSGSNGCFYCFQPGHMKKDCQLRAADRAKSLFRTNVNTEPGAHNKKKKTTGVGLNVVNNKYAGVAASVAKERNVEGTTTETVGVAPGAAPVPGPSGVPSTVVTAEESSATCDQIVFSDPAEELAMDAEFRYIGAVQHEVVSDGVQDVDMMEPGEP